MGRTLLLAWIGESFRLSAVPIWVRPLAIGLATQQGTGTISPNRPLAAFQKPLLQRVAFTATKFRTGDNKAAFDMADWASDQSSLF